MEIISGFLRKELIEDCDSHFNNHEELLGFINSTLNNQYF